MKTLDDLEKRLHVNFLNKDLLLQAMTHSSYSMNMSQKGIKHSDNERLEFLGDSVLGLAVSDFLYRAYPKMSERDLTIVRACLVSNRSCSELAKSLQLDEFLLGFGSQSRNTPMDSLKPLGQALEAIVGAIYKDQGYEQAQRFIVEHFGPIADSVIAKGEWQDPKSRLKERVESMSNASLVYELLSETGPHHKRSFSIGILLNGDLIATGEGPNRKSADMAAAANALKAKGW